MQQHAFEHIFALSPLEEALFKDDMATKKVAKVSLVPEIDEPVTAISVRTLGSRIKEKNAIAKERMLARQKAALEGDLNKISKHLCAEVQKQIQAFLDAEDPHECYLFTAEYDAHPYCAAAVKAGAPKDFVLAKALAEFAEAGEVTVTVKDNSIYVLNVEV